MSFAVRNVLKELRAELNLTQQDLADAVGVTRQTIIAIEGEKYAPSLELAFKLAKACKKTLEQVFTYTK